MTCERMREAASARLDGEPIGMSAAALDEHLARCAACARWVQEAVQATRGLRLRSVEVPDLTSVVLSAVQLPAAGRRGRNTVRAVLALSGLFQLVLACLGVFGDSVGMSMAAHAMHEAAAWNGALGVTFLLVAIRPRYAASAVIATAGFLVFLVPLTVHDLVVHAVGAHRVLTHVGCLVGLAAAATIARLDRPGTPPATATVAPPDVAGRSTLEGAA